MRVNLSTDESKLSSTFRLAKKCFSPLTGIGIQTGSFLRGNEDPPIICLGAQLTGVHFLLNRSEPKSSYHVGGSGLLEFEAFIKCIAETSERYSQLVSGLKFDSLIEFATYADMKERYKDEVLDASCFDFFTTAQLNTANFPFKSFEPGSTYGFIKLESLTGGVNKWAPVQIILLGYNVQKGKGETRILPAVTTGTATHTDPVKCLKNAILELIQIDSTMGNWYGCTKATRILPDSRISNLSSILNRTLSDQAYKIIFYLLPSADLAGFTTACLIDNGNQIPSVVVGLGSCTCLESSMYKSFVEAVSCHQLAKVISLKELFPVNGLKQDVKINTANIYDLDTNVFYYSLPENKENLLKRFDSGLVKKASELPPDIGGSELQQVKSLIDSFKKADKELLFLDLTTYEVNELGMMTFRVWSPDTLSLSIPSCPTLAHKRYNDYGKIQNTSIHPLP